VKSHVIQRFACLAALGAGCVLSMPAQGSVEEPVPAVWKERKLSFHYSSSIAVYACKALEGRVADLLRAVGARDDIRVHANNCDQTLTPATPGVIGPSGRTTARPMSAPYPEGRLDTAGRQSVFLLVTLMMPTEVTPEVLAELEKDKQRRELVARVSGNPAARFNDPVIFPADRQEVTLSQKTVGLEPEECELLDQMSTTVFQELGVSVVRKRTNCDRTRPSLAPPELVVESLMPAQPKPADDDGEEEPEETKPPVPSGSPTPAAPPAPEGASKPTGG
jgi:hypothetical protein